MLVLFMVGALIKSCDELPAFCESYGFETAYRLSLWFVVWNLVLVVVMVVLLLRSFLEASGTPTVRL